MEHQAGGGPLSERISTGVEGLDETLGGGIFRGGIYVVTGRPGAGKTVLGNQIVFQHVAEGGRALFVTLLAETHAMMLAQVGRLSFFDPAAIGDSLSYMNGYASLEEGGLDGLRKTLRDTVRQQRASLLVIDGVVTAAHIAGSVLDYKRFIQDLQTWVGMMRVTVLLLTSAGNSQRADAEHTMVDGVIELEIRAQGMRALRELEVTKLRGSGFLEGRHPYLISRDGMSVFPRFEARFGAPTLPTRSPRRVSTGAKGLDPLFGGGLSEGSTTLVLGSSGSGKTVLGLHFLAAGGRAGEPGLHFGFFEPPEILAQKGDRLGLGLSALLAGGQVAVEWEPQTELHLDAIGHRLLRVVDERKVRRLVFDGLSGVREAAAYPSRLGTFFAALAQELAARGVTTLLTEETQELFVRRIEIPTRGVSAICHNILFLRQVESGGELRRLLSVMKTRDSAHERGLHAFELTDRGFEVEGRFGQHSALRGVPEDHEPPSGRDAKKAPRSAKKSSARPSNDRAKPVLSSGARKARKVRK